MIFNTQLGKSRAKTPQKHSKTRTFPHNSIWVMRKSSGEISALFSFVTWKHNYAYYSQRLLLKARSFLQTKSIKSIYWQFLQINDIFCTYKLKELEALSERNWINLKCTRFQNQTPTLLEKNNKDYQLILIFN